MITGSLECNYPEDDYIAPITPRLESICCGAPPLGETNDYMGPIVGICSRCKDHTIFEQEIEDER